MDPINTLRQPFKAPGGSGWMSPAGFGAANNNAPGRPGSSSMQHHEGAGGAPFILYHAQNGNHASTSSPSAWPEAAARAVKRAKNNAGGQIYRDGESTGYEDDGSEAPSVDNWTAARKVPSFAPQAALRDNTNGHREASTSYPPFAGLKPRHNDSPAGQGPIACTRYFQVSQTTSYRMQWPDICHSDSVPGEVVLLWTFGECTR